MNTYTRCLGPSVLAEMRCLSSSTRAWCLRTLQETSLAAESSYPLAITDHVAGAQTVSHQYRSLVIRYPQTTFHLRLGLCWDQGEVSISPRSSCHLLTPSPRVAGYLTQLQDGSEREPAEDSVRLDAIHDNEQFQEIVQSPKRVK
jgi:hypothetical protein